MGCDGVAKYVGGPLFLVVGLLVPRGLETMIFSRDLRFGFNAIWERQLRGFTICYVRKYSFLLLSSCGEWWMMCNLQYAI